jgi:hypothetical protein
MSSWEVLTEIPLRFHHLTWPSPPSSRRLLGADGPTHLPVGAAAAAIAATPPRRGQHRGSSPHSPASEGGSAMRQPSVGSPSLVATTPEAGSTADPPHRAITAAAAEAAAAAAAIKVGDALEERMCWQERMHELEVSLTAALMMRRARHVPATAPQ